MSRLVAGITTLAVAIWNSDIWRAAARGWDRFWFKPADPTVLGFVRILIGALGLYVHFAYTGDLLDFVGPNGWLSKETLDTYRREVGAYVRPSDWSDPNDMTPVDPTRPFSAEELAYIREWDGVNPRKVEVRGYWAFSIFYHVTDPTWIYIIHGCVLLVFFMLTIGLGTRVVSVLAWLATMSYLQRHYVAFFGMDTILSFATLYLMVGPCGAALSVDRLIERYARAWRALRARSSRKATLLTNDALRRAEGLELDPPQPRVWANIALRLLQVHVCIVYFASGTSKLMGPSWWNGTAIWGTMINPEFSPVYSPTYMGALRWLCEHRVLWEMFMTGGVLFTLFFEISFIYLIWNRWTRVPMMIAAVMLHAGIAFFMGLTTFSAIMIAVVASFTPPELLERLIRKLTKGWDELRLAYDPRDRAQVRAAALVRTFDPWNQVRAVEHASLHDAAEPTPDENHASVSEKPLHLTSARGEPAPGGPVRLITDKGESLTGAPAFARLTQALRLLWPAVPLAKLPGALGMARLFFPEGSGGDLTERRTGRSEKVAH